MARIDPFRDLLLAHHPADPREAGFVEAMRALAEHGDSAFDRHHYEPGHFTASAFVLSPDERDLLLILHGKLGLWLQPGGHLEPSDGSILEAARREVREEVGLADVEVLGAGLFDVDVHEIPESLKAPRHRHYDARFLFRAPTRDVVAGDDARAVRWVPVREVLEAAHVGREDLPTDESVLRAVRRLAAR